MSIFATLYDYALALEEKGHKDTAERLTDYCTIASEIDDIIEVLDILNEQGKLNDTIDNLINISESLRFSKNVWHHYEIH